MQGQARLEELFRDAGYFELHRAFGDELETLARSVRELRRRALEIRTTPPYKLPLRTLKIASIENGWLTLATLDGPMALELGADAPKWGRAIANPKTRADKLGIKKGDAVCVLNFDDREFEAEITEQTPDQRVAWRSTSGVDQAGVVTFHALDDEHTRVTLQMDFEPEGIAEQIGDKTGVVRARTKGDLERFKEFIEDRRTETGAWRGEIERN